METNREIRRDSEEPPYEVFEYDSNTLRWLFACKSLPRPGTKTGKQLEDYLSCTKKQVIDRKTHCHFFEKYFDLKEIGAKTILSENRYIDKSYLEDFSNYYVRCFRRYNRHCVRLHFFSYAFTEEEFSEFLVSSGEQRESEKSLTHECLQDHYLGFIVIRPLPQSIFGRTCLVPHKTTDDSTANPAIMNYRVHLFGVPLNVEALAYQEQDSVVAICATSALWSLMQRTASLFQHPVLSPIEITRTAFGTPTPETRTLRRTGLNPEQMAQVIRRVELEPYVVNPASNHCGSYLLRSTTYAYLRGGIPLILGMKIFETSKESIDGEECYQMTREIGPHAVTITGYTLSRELSAFEGDPETLYENQPDPGASTTGHEPEHGFYLRATRIGKIHVHDDQIGPYAHMHLDGKYLCGGNSKFESMSTLWADDADKPARALPTLLMVALYHKIRIPFETIHNAVFHFDSFLEFLQEQMESFSMRQRIEWDIYLTSVNDVKSETRSNENLDEEACLAILRYSMPKYIWRAIGRELGSGDTLIELLFDPTDFEQGQYFIRPIEYDINIASAVRAATQNEKIMQVWRDTSPLDQLLPILNWYTLNQDISTFQM